MGTPDDAYQQLASVFSTRESQVLEIEMIPSTSPAQLLQDGLCIGLTKKILVAAYTVARELFKKRLMSMTIEDHKAALFASKPDSSNASDRVITEIMLLFDCEHLSACNWRKRWLRAAVDGCAQNQDQINSTKQALNRELTLLTTYQCSPLHRHTKSPTLWSHRLWALRQLFQIEHWDRNALLQLAQAELNGVLRAGELHPKNYYAFAYMQQLHHLLSNVADVTNMADRSIWSVQQARALLDPVLVWCMANPRDISGWMLAKYLLGCISEQQVRAEALRKIVVFARDIGWKSESLWNFVGQTAHQFELERVLDDLLPPPPGDDGLTESILLRDVSCPKLWPWLTLLARAQIFWDQGRREQIPNLNVEKQ